MGRALMEEEKEHIIDYLEPGLISFLEGVLDRDEALSHLVNLLAREGKLRDAEGFYQAILNREHIVSTGVGMGVAIPHAKLEGYKHFFIAVGICSPKGIEWGSLDALPVHLIFMIGGPDNQQTKYLKILSSLTESMRDPKNRESLLRARSSIEVMKVFERC